MPAPSRHDDIPRKTAMKLPHAFALALFALAPCLAGAQTIVHGQPATTARAATLAPKLQTLYSNLGPMDKLYQPGLGPAVAGGKSDSPLQFYATPFTPSIDASVTGLVLPIAYKSGNAQSLGVALFSDDGGKPGSELYSWTGLTPFNWTTAAGKPFPCCSYFPVTAEAGAIPVAAGTTYWVVARTTPSGNMSAVWLYNASGATGRSAYLDSSGQWSVPPATDLPALAVYGVKQSMEHPAPRTWRRPPSGSTGQRSG